MTVVFLVQRDGEPERVTYDIEEAARALQQGVCVTFRVPGNGTLSNARTLLTPAWVTSLRDLTRRAPAFRSTADAV